MWNSHNAPPGIVPPRFARPQFVPPGFVYGQRMELNSGMMAQQPWGAAVNVSPWSPAYIGVPSGPVQMNALINPIRPYFIRTEHPDPFALDAVHPGIPAPWIPEPLPPPPSEMWAALDHYQTTTREKCYDTRDPTLTFVDREDELDFLYEDFKSPRALMSCGHAVTPMSLTNWCQRLLDQGKTRFVCGQTDCNAEWSYEEVCKMALLTPEEKMHFEKAMKSNVAMRNTKPCPVCKSPVLRLDQSNLRVRCTVCTATNRRIYEFCWQCMREWRGPASRSDHCDNEGCNNESLKTLQTCPEILLDFVKCPSIRACPTCGILLQHDNTGCDQVDCPRCGNEFCFVCLEVSDECLSEELETFCHRVAPRQTSIPVWHE